MPHQWIWFPFIYLYWRILIHTRNTRIYVSDTSSHAIAPVPEKWPWGIYHQGTGTLNDYQQDTVYPKKYAHGFCFAVLCCGYTLTDFPISIRYTSLALWQSNDCPSASKATLMNMDKYFMWIHYERLHNHNKAKHNKTVCIFLGVYCTYIRRSLDIFKNQTMTHYGNLSVHLIQSDLSPCQHQFVSYPNFIKSYAGRNTRITVQATDLILFQPGCNSDNCEIINTGHN